MFELVARPETRRRSPEAVFLSLLVCLGVGAVAVLAFPAVEAAVEEVLPVPLEYPIEIRLPPAPAPAPAVRPSGGGGGRPSARPTPPPVVAAPDVPTPDLALTVEPGPADPEAPACVGADCAGGPGKGPPGDGPPGGDGTCVGPDCGGGGDGLRVVHWSEVKPTRRVSPEFPEAAFAAGLREGDCTVRIDIDAHGVPTDVRATRCPEVFAPSAVAAARQWRFAPLPGGVPARFELRVQYRSR